MKWFRLLLFLVLCCLVVTATTSAHAQSFKRCFDIQAAGKYAEAEQCFQRLVVQNSKSAEIHYYLGQAMRKHGQQIGDEQRLQEAIDHYRQAIHLNKNQYAYAWNGLGNAFNELDGIIDDGTNYLEESIKAYQAALKAPNQPGPPTTAHVAAHVNLAIILNEQGKFTEALEEIQRAVQLDPKYYGIYDTWGNMLYRMGVQELRTGRRDLIGSAQQKLQQAIAKYQQTKQLNSNYAESYVGLGETLMALDDYRGAISEFQSALQRSPFALAYVYDRWGNALEALGDLDGAIEKYNAATQVKSLTAKYHHIAFAYVDWGRTLAEQARNGDESYRTTKWAEALNEFQQALNYPNDEKISDAQDDPSIHAIAHNNMGLISWQQGNLETAIDKFDDALGVSPRFPAARSNFKEVNRLVLLRTKQPIPLGNTEFLSANPQTQIKRAVVRVISQFWTRNSGIEEGTGWIVGRQGNKIWIVTNQHVVVARGQNADEVEIELYYGDDLPKDNILLPRVTARIFERTGAKDDVDLALLEVISPEFPQDIGHLSISNQTNQRNDGISVVGNSDFRWVNGTVVDASPTTLTLTPRLEQGYSGSPLLNAQNQVVGLFYLLDPKGKPHSYAHPSGLVVPKLQKWSAK